MNANDVITSYVNDVAVRLPRRLRNDVAFELRALLDEELQAKAHDAGCGADAAMATGLVRAFGRPADVAARYAPALTIIDPADGHLFLRATVIGLAVLWCLGLLAQLQQPLQSGSDVLRAAGQWWGATVIPSLWWPGMLVVGFGIAAWGRRRAPQAAEWTPRDEDRIPGGRATLVLAVIGIVCGLTVLIEPRWLLDAVWSGRAAPAAYAALTYADAFRMRQGPCLLVLLLLNLPLLIAVIAQGRWTVRLRRLETALGLATCAVMAWAVVGGPIFMADASDRVVKLVMVLSIAYTLAMIGIRAFRSVRPAPDPSIQAQR